MRRQIRDLLLSLGALAAFAVMLFLFFTGAPSYGTLFALALSSVLLFVFIRTGGMSELS